MHFSGTILALFAFWSPCVAAETVSFPRPEGVKSAKNQFMIQFENSSKGQDSKQSILDSPDKGIALVKEIKTRNIGVVNFPSARAAKNWLKRKGEGVKYFEENHMMYVDTVSATDYQTRNLAESVPYGIGHVNALEVPDDYVGNRKVCIIDSGYDINHPDLPSDPNLFTGESFVGGSWNTDENSHGTHVAGTIVALEGNNQGVVGVIRNGLTKLHISKVFDASGSTATSTVIEGFESCVENGADVINMSLGGGGYSQAFADVISDAESAGVLTFASSGNTYGYGLQYPASYPYVISVASITESYQRSSFSTYGPEVDISAPGSSVLSTVPGGGYSSYSGTSMACPHAVGVAALVWSHDITLTNAELRNILQTTVEDLGTPGRDDYFGHGLVDAKAAFDVVLAGLSPTVSPAPSASPSTSAPTLPCLQLEIELITDSWASETSFTVTDPNGNVIIEENSFSNDFSYAYSECLTPKCDYTFTIYDSFGDGICCAYGEGSYTVTYDGVEVGSGGNFGSSESVSFGCVTLPPNSPPTASPSSSPSASPTITCVDSTFPIAYTEIAGGTSIPCEFVPITCLCDDPNVKSHCPATCDSCAEYECVNSAATFYTPQGNAVTCSIFDNIDPGLVDTYCAIPEVRMTCRDSCGVCGP